MKHWYLHSSFRHHDWGRYPTSAFTSELLALSMPLLSIAQHLDPELGYYNEHLATIIVFQIIHFRLHTATKGPDLTAQPRHLKSIRHGTASISFQP
jgi:hypothetical protein